MFSSRQIVLIIAGALAISLGAIGGLRYPLFNDMIVNVVLYGTSVVVGIIGLLVAIDEHRLGILIIVGVAAVSLGIIGGLSYPLAYDGLLGILLYEILVILGISGILLLINYRGLEEE